MKVNDFISKEQARAVTQAVHEAELKTVGEIVPMVVNRSDTYPGATWRIAVVVMLMLAGIEAWVFPDMPLMMLLFLQLPGLIVGLWLGSIPSLEKMAINPKEMEEEVRQRAIQAFFNQKLHITRERIGVLIFVSMMEHRVEILADVGISEKIAHDEWEQVVEQLSSAIKQKKIGEGLIQAIHACGERLQKHFPIREDVQNELKNELVLMDM